MYYLRWVIRVKPKVPGDRYAGYLVINGARFSFTRHLKLATQYASTKEYEKWLNFCAKVGWKAEIIFLDKQQLTEQKMEQETAVVGPVFVGGMTSFGYALAMLKGGQRVSRYGWNGKGMWLTLVKPQEPNMLPYSQLKTVDDKLVPWLASQTDLLAEDWSCC